MLLRLRWFSFSLKFLLSSVVSIFPNHQLQGGIRWRHGEVLCWNSRASRKYHCYCSKAETAEIRFGIISANADLNPAPSLASETWINGDSTEDTFGFLYCHFLLPWQSKSQKASFPGPTRNLFFKTTRPETKKRGYLAYRRSVHSLHAPPPERPAPLLLWRTKSEL